MVIGGTLGILFVTLLRRVMVEDPDLPFSGVRRRFGNPQGRPARLQGRQDSVCQYGLWRIHVPAGRRQRIQPEQYVSRHISALGKKLLLRTSTNPSVATTITGGATIFTAPDVSPLTLVWATSLDRVLPL